MKKRIIIPATFPMSDILFSSGSKLSSVGTTRKPVPESTMKSVLGMVARHRRRRLGTVGSGSYSFAMFMALFRGADSRGSWEKDSRAILRCCRLVVSCRS